MFIVPLTGKISWRNPPLITIIIILINCLVFFIFQSNDNEKYIHAMEYYHSSGLDRIEIPAYLSYLQTHDNHENVDVPESLNREYLIRTHQKLEADAQFLEKLRQEQIITKSHPSYHRWKALRREYEKRIAAVVFLNYGFIPAYKKPITFLTHMFLHGGLGHLIGNMIFLWIVGCVIELGCGRSVYSVLYLSTGLIAVVFFGLIHMNSTTPLVGASGAISGLMGALPVLFGKKKIKIFYSLGFFFNYIKIPAFILLPLWVGNELLKQTFSGNTHVAYVAHIGGLIGGGLIAFIIVKFPGLYDTSAFAAVEEEEDKLSPLIEEALDHIEKLDMDGARRLLDQVLSQDPANVTAMTHLFNMDKINPESQQFHSTAKKILKNLLKQKNMDNTFYDFYDQYNQLVNKPQLSAEIYVNVAAIAAAKNQTETAEKIIAGLLKQKPNTPGLSSTLLKLSIAFGRKNMEAKRKTCLKIIRNKFPNSTEAQIAGRALSNSLE